MAFLNDFLNKRNIPFLETAEGICYTVERSGSGPRPQRGEYAMVHYTGYLLDGTKFDSSLDYNEPFVFQVGAQQVIQGWDLGIPLFAKGAKGTLYLPAHLAYGAQGAGDVIPPNAALRFEIEVLDILDEAAYAAYQERQELRQQEALMAYLERQLGIDVGLIQAHIAKGSRAFEMTETGLHVHVAEQGTGPQAIDGSTVTVHYTGRLLNGTKFDSSYDRQRPISFPLGEGRVISGWEEGIVHFRQGGKGTLLIPSPLGYGPRDMGPIPANSVLEFDIELVSVA
ncbi:MAG: hypothetical protein OHK0039_07730 [Bacteroidia bacterium]